MLWYSHLTCFTFVEISWLYVVRWTLSDYSHWEHFLSLSKCSSSRRTIDIESIFSGTLVWVQKNVPRYSIIIHNRLHCYDIIFRGNLFSHSPWEHFLWQHFFRLVLFILRAICLWELQTTIEYLSIAACTALIFSPRIIHHASIFWWEHLFFFRPALFTLRAISLCWNTLSSYLKSVP